MKGTAVVSYVFKVVLLVMLLVLGYLTTPTLAYDFAGGWFFGLLALAILSMPGDWANQRDGSGWARPILVFLLGFVLFIIVSIVTTWSAFHAQAYRELLGPVQTVGKFEAGLPPIDLAAAPLVDESMARRVAEKRLSDVPAMGSQYKLGKLTKQRIGSKLTWIGFLEYNSIFVQWNEGHTPGYIRVSATDINDVQLVTKLNGRDIELRYLEDASFGKNVERHVWASGYMGRGVTQFVAHLDEAGNPYYVATLYRHAVGFDGEDATGALTIDVQTGDIKEYSLSSAPAWVDRIYTDSMLEAQVKDYGELVHGWFNPSDEGRLKPSGEMVFVDGNNNSYWYTGVTNYKAADTSVSGFLLVDARSKKARLYQISGASEETAQKAATGVIPEKHYGATYPLPFSIDKVPTYVMSLKDDTGIARAYAMVSIENYQVLAVGDTLTSTLRAYQARVSGDATKLQANTGNVKVEVITSSVERIASDTHSGMTIYYVTVQGDAKHLFTGGIDLSEKLPLTHAGDRVELSYVEGDTTVANLKSFDNQSISQGSKQKQ
jgi:hypothetical protein